jgi:cell division protein FtsI/penicillin-binding protein 2
MANYPTYNPSQYSAVTDQSLFTNNAVSYPYEPGSVMKPLLLGAAFTEGTATPQTSFFDPNYVIVDGQRINNSEYWAPQTESLQEVINKSLNTGAVFILKTLGGGQIDEKARTTWYDYLSQHYFFGQNTGIQQTDEQPGILYGPDSGSGIDFRYANMAFGQGITVTPLQLITAYCAILNGGTYYKPSLIANTDSNGNLLPFKPTVVARNVISAEASSEIRSMLEISLNYNNSAAERAGYDIGAKSGTAQIAGPNGSYLPNVYIGTYIGFIAGAGGVQYVMTVRLDQPVITSANTFASGLAAKVWTQMEKNLLNNYAIQPNNP